MAFDHNSARAYLRSIELAKGALDENDNDRSFVRRATHPISHGGSGDGEIVYIFDTNVCEAFINAESSVSSNRTGFTGLFHKPEFDLIEELWLRLLFEGTLPGQRGPVLVSAEHWHELGNRIEVLLKQHVRAMAAPQVPIRLLELAKKAAEHDNLFELAEALCVSQELQKLSVAVQLHDRIKILFDNRTDDERRIHSLPFSDFWIGVEDKVRFEDFRFWRGAIGAQRKARPGQEANLENDALTIASIETMYRLSDRKEDLRFLFVTADRTIEEAIAQNYARLQNAGIPNFIRSPDNYMPLINYRFISEKLFHANRAMGPEATQKSEKFLAEVEAAIQLAFDKPNHRDRGRDSVGGGRWTEVRTQWSKAARLLSYAVAPYFALHDEDLDDRVRNALKMFERPGALDQFTDQLYATLDHIKKDHARQGTASILGRLASEVHEAEYARGREKRRAPLRLLDVDPLEVVTSSIDGLSAGIGDMDDFLDWLADQPSGGEIANQQIFAELEHSWHAAELKHKALMLASSIYFSARRWRSARICANLAARELTPRAANRRIWLREARFAEALALRMTLMSRSEFDRAEFLLGKNLSLPERNIAKERDRLEKGALLLTASVNQAIEFATPFENVGSRGEFLDIFERDEIADAFDAGLVDTLVAIEYLEDLLAVGNLDTIKHLYVRGKSNVLGALVAAYLIPGLTHQAVTREDVRDALRETNETHEEFTLKVRAMPSFYSSAAKVLIWPTSENLAELDSLVEQYSPEPDADVYLTRPDRDEVQFIHRGLRQFVRFST